MLKTGIFKIFIMYVVTNVLFTGVISPVPLHCIHTLTTLLKIRRLIMLYREKFNISHTLGDRTCSSVIDIVLR